MSQTAKVLSYGARGVLMGALVGAAASWFLACSSGGSSSTLGSPGPDGGGCAFADQWWANPAPRGQAGSVQFWFGSNGCFDIKSCTIGDNAGLYCNETYGTWTPQSGCGTVDTISCNTAMDTLTISQTAQGLAIVDQHNMGNNDSYTPAGTTAPARCGLAGPLGAPAWSGTETVKFVCGTQTRTSKDSVSGLSFQQTDAGFSFTDNQGCMLDFAETAGMATLAAPATCNIMTDAGTATTLTVSSATLTICDGHDLTGTLDGTLTEGTTQCQFTATLTLHR
jgi:hypothetical protein